MQGANLSEPIDPIDAMSGSMDLEPSQKSKASQDEYGEVEYITDDDGMDDTVLEQILASIDNSADTKIEKHDATKDVEPIEPTQVEPTEATQKMATGDAYGEVELEDDLAKIIYQIDPADNADILKKVDEIGAMLHKKPIEECKGFASKYDAAIDKLEEALKDGNIDPRSNLGGQFRYDLKLDPEKAQAYKVLNRDAAKKFRMEWAKTKLQDHKEKKSKMETWRRIDVETGVYRNWDQLVSSQSGGQKTTKDSILGSTKLAMKCMKMGPPWVKKNTQTERMMFLELHFEYSEEFEENWSKYREESLKAKIYQNEDEAKNGKGQGSQDGDGSKEGDGATDGGKGGKVKTLKPKPKVKQNKNSGGGEPEGKRIKKGDEDPKDFNGIWAKALKLKASYVKFMGSADAMMDQIKRRKEWNWANNEENRGELEETVSKVKMEMGDFHKTFVAEDPMTLKKTYGQDFLMKELKGFLEPKSGIENVMTVVNRLNKRHTA